MSQISEFWEYGRGGVGGTICAEIIFLFVFVSSSPIVIFILQNFKTYFVLYYVYNPFLWGNLKTTKFLSLAQSKHLSHTHLHYSTHTHPPLLKAQRPPPSPPPWECAFFCTFPRRGGGPQECEQIIVQVTLLYSTGVKVVVHTVAVVCRTPRSCIIGPYHQGKRTILNWKRLSFQSFLYELECMARATRPFLYLQIIFSLFTQLVCLFVVHTFFGW